LTLASNERIREANDDVVRRSCEVADAVRPSGHNGCVAEDQNEYVINEVCQQVLTGPEQSWRDS
jgi:hypothetical protein